MASEEKIVFKEEEKLDKYYRADFICYDSVILEIKSVKFVPNTFYTQLNNYLTATKKELGILVNFGQPSLTYKRIVNTRNSR